MPANVILLTSDYCVPKYSEVLANIMIAAWRNGFREILEESIIEKYTQFPSVKAMFFRLLTSGVGCMYLSALEETSAGLLYWLEEQGDARIEALLTIPEVWGKGVSAALMGRALADIKAAGYSVVHVWPFAENHRARRFYEKQGFHPSGQTRMGDAAEVEYLCYL